MRLPYTGPTHFLLIADLDFRVPVRSRCLLKLLSSHTTLVQAIDGTVVILL